jgi:predicted acetyltransferase
MGEDHPMRSDISFRTARPEDLDAMFDRDAEAFAGSYTADERVAWRNIVDMDRFRLALDGSTIVGIAGSHALELTLPGGGQVSMGGLTWVSVAPTHRRQGILRRLMDDVHADIDGRGEPIAGLLASDAGIYERFGYGASTRRRYIQIDRRRFPMAQSRAADPSGIQLADPLDHLDHLASIYDRYRRSRVGEVSRTSAWIEMRIRDNVGVVRSAIHADGYALWTVKEDWNVFDAQHELHLSDVIACTPEAHSALWNLVLSHDLIGPVRCEAAVALDDPLPLLLENPRGMKTEHLHDFLWLCPRRIGDLLAARRYRIEDRMVIEVDGERWQVAGGPDGAEAQPTDLDADVVMTSTAFGPLLLGGVTATELSLGGRLTGRNIGRIDAFFGWSPLPHCSTPF